MLRAPLGRGEDLQLFLGAMDGGLNGFFGMGKGNLSIVFPVDDQ